MAKYEIEVELVGTDGNVFSLIGKVLKAIRREIGTNEAKLFSSEAMNKGSYDEVLTFITETVEVQ